jgi:hypothetical protein
MAQQFLDRLLVSGDFANGSIGDVRIYNRALSKDEIKRLYNMGGTVKLNTARADNSLAQGLVGWWTFDGKDLTSTTAIDRANPAVQTSQTFTTSTTWTAPGDVTSVTVEAWGGGGAGGGETGNPSGGGGGAGGSYCKKVVSVTGGTSYTVTVGAAVTGTTGAGARGNDSWFSSKATVFAGGGDGGLTTGTGGVGNAGTAPGGGGGGGRAGNATDRAGGDGARGQIILTYTTASQNNGTLNGGPVPTFGKIGQGMSFDGSNDYVDVPHNSVLNPTSSGAFSISLWFRPTILNTPSGGGADYMVSKGDPNTNDSYSFVNSDLLGSYLGCNIGHQLANGTTLKYATSNLTQSRWYHGVCQSDGS